MFHKDIVKFLDILSKSNFLKANCQIAYLSTSSTYIYGMFTHVYCKKIKLLEILKTNK